jgi:para-nitrobenzyl esterase
MRSSIVLLLVACWTPAVARARSEPPTLATAQGRLAGTSMDGVTAYLGVPYAQPPVGDLRWRSPQPPKAWKGVRQAVKFGPACVQAKNPENGPWDNHWHPEPPFVEDCLTLNVWTPAKSVGGRLPVAFWIYGGGLIQGGSSSDTYNGAEFAKQGVVVVTVNYRVGVPGYFAHAELSKESADHVSGNYGFQDVVAALHWVQANIGAFGGDPAKVTVVGQSAGGRTVHILLSSPRARGLFRGAIAESSIPGVMPTARDGDRTLAEMEAAGEAYGKAKDAPTLAKLRQLPADALAVPNGGVLAAAEVSGASYPVGFTVDGVWLPKQTSASIDEAPVVDVPVLIGHNKDEGDIRIPLTQKVPVAEFDRRVKGIYGDQARELEALYPLQGDDASKAQQTAGHDRVMFGVQRWAMKRTQRASNPVFMYNFGHVLPGYTAKDWGSFHTSEVPYWMRTLNVLGRPLTADDRKVSDQLSAYWLNFIRTGNPNGAGLPTWRPVTPGKSEVMELDVVPHMRPMTDSPKIEAFFQRFYKH